MAALSALTAVATDFLLPRAAWLRPTTLALLLVPSGAPVLPEACILVARALAFRRACAKDPGAAAALRATLARAIASGYVGTDAGAARAGALGPAPPPSHPTRKGWTVWPRPQGPLHLLLYSLHLAGAALTGDAVIIQFRGPDLPLLAGPVQWLRRQLGALAGRAALRALERDRPEFDGVADLDIRLTMHLLRPRRAAAGCGGQQTPEVAPRLSLLRYRLAGALATSEALADRALSDPGCVHCGAAVGSHCHVLWRCPAFAHLRDASLLDELGDPDLLPVCLRDFGLAPELSADTCGTYWVRDSPGRPSGQPCPGIGITLTYTDAAARPVPCEPGLSARAYLDAARSTPTAWTAALPGLADGPAPAAPNAFSDASVRPTATSELALAAYAVWRPGAVAGSADELAEQLIAPVAQLPTGVLYANALFGPVCSTGRVELAGALAALYAPGPLHLATDSAYVMAGYRALIDNAIDLDRKPWLLRPDGDLWGHFQAAFLARGGVRSTRLSKVKAHLEEAAVEDGRIPREQWLGNARADGEATAANRFHGPALGLFSRVAAARQERYQVLVGRIQRHILAIDSAAATRLGVAARTGPALTMRAKARRREPWYFRGLAWAARVDARRIEFAGDLCVPPRWPAAGDFSRAAPCVLGLARPRPGCPGRGRCHLAGVGDRL